MRNVTGSQNTQIVMFTSGNGEAEHAQFDKHLPLLQVSADWIKRKLK